MSFENQSSSNGFIVAASRRWRWIGALAAAAALGAYAGWDWLVATGLATILLALAPCLAMCALGLCMGRGKGKSEAPLADVRRTYETQSHEPPRRS